MCSIGRGVLMLFLWFVSKTKKNKQKKKKRKIKSYGDIDHTSPNKIRVNMAGCHFHQFSQRTGHVVDSLKTY